MVSETYHSAIGLRREALKALDYHPFKVEQIKAAFTKTDEENRNYFYEEWLKGEDQNRFTLCWLNANVPNETKEHFLSYLISVAFRQGLPESVSSAAMISSQIR